MSFTVASGVKTQYQHIGKTGPLLVMLHGWGHDWQTWSPLIPALSEHYQLLLVDLPAFGQSEAPTEPWSSERYATWLGEFFSIVVPHKRLVIMGHSFGGKVAALWAATQPGLLRALVLCDAAGLPDPLSMKQQLIQAVASLVPAKMKRLVSLGVRRRLLEGAGAATDHLNSTPTQRRILKVIVREYIAESLLKITVPTLLLWGENDQDTTPSQAKKFAQLIPNSQLEIVPNAGHFVFHDQPQTVLSHLLPFLKSVTME